MSNSSMPVPRRFNRPRWLDPRIIGGVLLVIIAVVLGARVIGASAKTVPVWATTGALAAGTVLGEDDLTVVNVNLGESGSRYLSTDVSPAGMSLAVDVGAGELIPATVLTPGHTGRILVIGIEPEGMPPGVIHGSRVDLYLTVATSVREGGPQTEQLAAGLTVQTVSAPASGGLSGAASRKYQISVQLEPADAERIVRRLPTGDVTAVLITGEAR